ncbi:MAG: hypothetical protein AB7U73_09135 [Pirellulales bacterium]
MAAGLLASLALVGGPALLPARDIEPSASIKTTPNAVLKWAPRRDGTTKPASSKANRSSSTAAGETQSAAATRPADSSNLRWKPYREVRRHPATRPQQTAGRSDSSTAGALDATDDRAAAHRRHESQHVVQTSGTRPRDNAFDDPFFSEEAAQTITKPEPIVLPALGPTPADPFREPQRVAQRQPTQRDTDLRPGVDPLDLAPQDEAVDRAAEEMPEPETPLEQPESELGPTETPYDSTLPEEGLDDEPTLDEPRQPYRTPPSTFDEPDSGSIEDSFRTPPSEPEPGESTWEQDLAQLREGQEPQPCKRPEEILKRIRDITSDISADAGDFPPECPLGDAPFEPRMWAMTSFHWKASGLCHKPLYFEQVGVERYGHSLGPILQPIWSGVDFYGRIFLLPYEMGIEPPWECVYALGYYRPGSCAPKMIFPFPVSIRGGLLEAGAVLGAVYLLP